MLKSSLFFSLILSLFSFAIAAQSEQGELSVKFSGTTNSKGKIMIRISDSKGEDYKLLSLPADAQPLEIKIALKPGAYAIAAYHDENDNQKLDKAFTGIPTENYGFSNNARGMFGPPSLKEQLLTVKQSTATTIRLE